MNVTKEVLLYFTARIDIIHVGVDYHLKHHFRMIRTTARFLIKLLETLKIEVVNNTIAFNIKKDVCKTDKRRYELADRMVL